ncbi:hypothetical protein GIB67_002274 [Kingdonia uniflora]|uniref:Mediator of RNA polymerase II transcription subunit 4 n=1 Tax=Kingdonia uniflora TaxID=39325 RepID=A0A7J7KWY7_9MAGN|nr:hypothetical protein GIB67_002274 [Kingdonia uniflora]
MLQNHPSQILQSPSRLVFTNPNSPALSTPQTPQQQQQPQTPLQLSTTPPPPQPPTTSSTLLSLLPPHTRAQSLLLQMSSLASKLFELSPNRSLWFASFRGSLPNFLPPQTGQTPDHNLPPLDFSGLTTKDAVALFTSLQTQLFEAVSELQEILDLQDRKQELAREVRAKDAAVMGFARKVKEVEHVLDVLVDDYADYRRPKRVKVKGEGTLAEREMGTFDSSTVSSKLNLSEVLSYAHRISYTTFAPPEFGAGQGPLRGSLPPAPQEEQMRASQLYNFADLDIGLPKVVDSKEGIIEEQYHETMPVESNSVVDLVGQGVVPPQIMVPSGWRPGMPIELPTDLPMPPSGWKPGDPVPLPPLPVESRSISQIPLRTPEPNQPIQVGFVDIDIPDEDSSDYSSEEDDED